MHGQFTAADMQLTFFEELLEAMLPIGRWPNLQAHLAGSREIDGYKRAEAKGGPVGIRPLFGRLPRAMSGDRRRLQYRGRALYRGEPRRAAASWARRKTWR